MRYEPITTHGPSKIEFLFFGGLCFTLGFTFKGICYSLIKKLNQSIDSFQELLIKPFKDKVERIYQREWNAQYHPPRSPRRSRKSSSLSIQPPQGKRLSNTEKDAYCVGIEAFNNWPNWLYAWGRVSTYKDYGAYLTGKQVAKYQDRHFDQKYERITKSKTKVSTL